MADKTVAQKLMIKQFRRVRFIHLPENGLHLIGELPEGAAAVHLNYQWG
jgi:hypothetical protein